MFTSVASMLRRAEEENKPLWEVILADDLADRGVKREVHPLWRKWRACGGP